MSSNTYSNVHVEIANKVRADLYETLNVQNDDSVRNGGRQVFMKLTETGVALFIQAIRSKAQGTQPREILPTNDMTPKEARFLNEQVKVTPPARYLQARISVPVEISEEAKALFLEICKLDPEKREVFMQMTRHVLPKAEAFGMVDELANDLAKPGTSGLFYDFTA